MPRAKKPPATSTSSRPTKNDITFQSPLGDVDKIPTRLWSFDRAIGGGIPYRSTTEISGYEHVGKSTLANYLSGVCADRKRDWLLFLALELADPKWLESNLHLAGFRGTVFFTPPFDEKKKPRTGEDMLDAFLDELERNEKIAAAVLDSVSAVSPTAEVEGSVKEAHMGLKARIMGSFMRRADGILIRRRQTPACLFLVNHLHPNLGVPGANTSGGKAIHNFCSTRFRLSLVEGLDDGSMLLEGRIVKLRFRGPAGYRETFKVFIKSGAGVHPGLTAVQDCLDYGLAEKNAGRISLKGKTYGLHSKLIDTAWNDPEVFEPFQAALANYKD